MQGILKLEIVSGSGVGYGTPDFDALSERSNNRRDSQSTVAGPPSCASVALRRRLAHTRKPSVLSSWAHPIKNLKIRIILTFVMQMRER